MTDQVQANKALVRTFHSGIWAGEVDLYEEHVASDYVGHDPGVPGGLQGPEAFREYVEGVRAGLSDIEHTIEDCFGEDDRVLVRGTVTARHTGEMMGIPATDRELSVEETIVYRLDDGMVAETWAAVDRLGMLQKLGVVEPPTP